jgi:hypothetical protein
MAQFSIVVGGERLFADLHNVLLTTHTKYDIFAGLCASITEIFKKKTENWQPEYIDSRAMFQNHD